METFWTILLWILAIISYLFIWWVAVKYTGDIAERKGYGSETGRTAAAFFSILALLVFMILPDKNIGNKYKKLYK